MTSSKPYLIRAIYEWIVDNNLTPHIAINTKISGICMPKEYLEGEQVVLNISPFSIKDLIVSNDALEFKASFNSINCLVYIPVIAVLAIYAKENNQGMAFPLVSSDGVVENKSTHNLSKNKPTLRLINGGKDSDGSSK